MTTEIVLAKRGAPLSLEDAQRELQALTDAGDVALLGEVASRARAARLYELRQGSKEFADRYFLLRLTAEAGIGQIDLRENPLPPFGPIGIDISPTMRSQWRILGTAQERGIFAELLAELEADSDRELSAKVVLALLRERGVTRVPTRALARRYQHLRHEKGLTIREVARQAGFDESHLSKALGGRRGSVRRPTIDFQRAKRVAAILGLNVSDLPLAPLKRKKVARSRLPRFRKMTGGRWDETYARLRRCLEEFAATAGEDQRWDDAYGHFYALEEIIARAMKR